MTTVSGWLGSRAEPDGGAYGASRHARWLGRIRLIAVLGFSVAALIGSWRGLIQEPAPFAIIAAGVLAYSVLLGVATRSGKSATPARFERLLFGQMLADVITLTAFLYFCGGAENPALIFYLLPIGTAGLLLRPGMSYIAAASAIALFGAVAVLQAAVPSLHHAMPFAFPGDHFQRGSFVGVVIGVLGAAAFLTAYVTTTIRSRLSLAEEQAIRSRNVLNSVIRSMAEGLLFLGPDGTVLLENPALVRWFRRDDRAAEENGWRGADLPEPLQEYIVRSREASSPLSPETFDIETPSEGARPAQRFRARASGVFSSEGEHLGYVIVVEDITEEWHLGQDLRARNREILAMDEALKKNQREMAQREKMVAIGTMAAGVAHEIGNPLAGLSAVVQLLRRRDPTAAQRAHLDTLDEQVRRIANIVRQLVEFARPASAERSVEDLDVLIEKTLSILQYSRHARQARVESIRNPELPRVRISPQHFQQVLLNLMLNALDAVEEGGSEPLVRVERVYEDGWVYVRVRDWGCGMTEDQARQAFEPFYTTKPPNKGTGLGLSVSYRLVEHQGGRIHIDSTPGKGTTVTVSFPGVSDETDAVDGGRKPGGVLEQGERCADEC